MQDNPNLKELVDIVIEMLHAYSKSDNKQPIVATKFVFAIFRKIL